MEQVQSSSQTLAREQPPARCAAVNLFLAAAVPVRYPAARAQRYPALVVLSKHLFRKRGGPGTRHLLRE